MVDVPARLIVKQVADGAVVAGGAGFAVGAGGAHRAARAARHAHHLADRVPVQPVGYGLIMA